MEPYEQAGRALDEALTSSSALATADEVARAAYANARAAEDWSEVVFCGLHIAIVRPDVLTAELAGRIHDAYDDDPDVPYLLSEVDIARRKPVVRDPS